MSTREKVVSFQNNVESVQTLTFFSFSLSAVELMARHRLSLHMTYPFHLLSTLRSLVSAASTVPSPQTQRRCSVLFCNVVQISTSSAPRYDMAREVRENGNMPQNTKTDNPSKGRQARLGPGLYLRHVIVSRTCVNKHKSLCVAFGFICFTVLCFDLLLFDLFFFCLPFVFL